MKTAVLAICGAFVLAGPAWGQAVKSHPEKQTPIDVKNIPKAVLIEFRREYPDAVIKWTKVESDHGWKRYQLHTVEGTLVRDILYDPDGTPMEIRQSIPIGVLPQQVVASIKAEAPKGRITGANLVRRDADLVYEVKVRTRGETRRLTYRSNGTLLESEKL